jgi:hypothetical protein
MAVTTTGSVPLPVNKKPAKRKPKDEKESRKFWSNAEERRYKMAMKKLGKDAD